MTHWLWRDGLIEDYCPTFADIRCWLDDDAATAGAAGLVSGISGMVDQQVLRRIKQVFRR